MQLEVVHLADDWGTTREDSPHWIVTLDDSELAALGGTEAAITAALVRWLAECLAAHDASDSAEIVRTELRARRSRFPNRLRDLWL